MGNILQRKDQHSQHEEADALNVGADYACFGSHRNLPFNDGQDETRRLRCVMENAIDRRLVLVGGLVD